MLENTLAVLQRVKHRTCDPAILLLGICPKEQKIRTQTDICTAMFIVFGEVWIVFGWWMSPQIDGRWT